jgi:hypothetical protein
MTHNSQSQSCAYSACVDFMSERWPYAREIYRIEAGDEFEAERQARIRAEDRVFYNLRIPDLCLSISVDPEGLSRV